MRTLIPVVGTAVVLAVASVDAQNTSASAAAERLSGTWTINLDLSPSVKPSGRSSGRSGGAAYAIGGFAPQRGRGGGGPGTAGAPPAPGDLTPEERAELSATQQLEQLAPTITVAATADTFSVVDQRGEQSCAINGKSAKIEMFGAKIAAKCRWNKLTVQQEFSTTRTKLTRSWSLDDSGHLVVKTRVEGLGQRAGEAAAVYDRRSAGS